MSAFTKGSGLWWEDPLGAGPPDSLKDYSEWEELLSQQEAEMKRVKRGKAKMGMKEEEEKEKEKMKMKEQEKEKQEKEKEQR